LIAAPVFYAWIKIELGMGCKPPISHAPRH